VLKIINLPCEIEKIETIDSADIYYVKEENSFHIEVVSNNEIICLIIYGTHLDGEHICTESNNFLLINKNGSKLLNNPTLKEIINEINTCNTN